MTAPDAIAEPAGADLPASDRPRSATRAILGASGALLAAGLGLSVASAPEHAAAIALGAGVAAAAAAAGGLLGVLLATRPIRGLTRAVQAMPGGRAPASGDDDVAELGRALNRLATEHDRSSDQLRTERDLLAGILEGMGEGVLVLDTDERIVLVNRALRAFARLDEDPRGKPLLEAIRNAALKEALDGVGSGADPIVREIELGRPLPRKLLVRVARLSHGGELRGTIAVFHDVTDLRRLETIRTDFVANVSHELRTPVTAISTATETLLGGALDDPDEAVEFVGVIDRHSKRLRQLVDDLLDLAKLEAKSFRLVLGELDVRPILTHAVELLGEPARRRRMTLVIAPGGAEILRARVDRRALEQVLMNLLDNAIKYAGEGARVTLSARAAAERVEISVADDGVGISPAHLGRVFERFYRVDNGRSRELGGTGLGLSIVKHLVELMGGTVEVESEPGKGARFTVRLQAAAGPAGPSPAPPSTP
jgi:two-component system phosphate regulon sensor histidine kinase PhoR